MPAEIDFPQHLAKLRVFNAVAVHKSIARTGQRLFKTPSAITRSIVALEHLLETPLFERTPRGMLINAHGKALFIRTRRIEDEIRAATEDIEARTGSRQGVDNILSNGRKLQLLIHLIDCRYTFVAAGQMNLTQAGASMSLSRAEAALGRPLFRRGPGGMIATETAERLVISARRVFSEFRHLRSDLAAVSGQLAGQVFVGSTPLGRAQVLPAAIATTIARHSDIHISTVEGRYDDLVSGLRNGSIDMVLGVLRPTSENVGLATERLFTDQLKVVVRSDHRLAKRKRLSLHDLVNENWIIPRRTAITRRQVDLCFKDLGLQPPMPSVETGDLAIVRQLLFTSDVLAVVFPHQLDQEIRSKTFCELPVSLAGTESDVGLIVREGALLSPAALTLLRTIRAQSAERVERS